MAISRATCGSTCVNRSRAALRGGAPTGSSRRGVALAIGQRVSASSLGSGAGGAARDGGGAHLQAVAAAKKAEELNEDAPVDRLAACGAGAVGELAARRAASVAAATARSVVAAAASVAAATAAAAAASGGLPAAKVAGELLHHLQLGHGDLVRRWHVGVGGRGLVLLARRLASCGRGRGALVAGVLLLGGLLHRLDVGVAEAAAAVPIGGRLILLLLGELGLVVVGVAAVALIVVVVVLVLGGGHALRRLLAEALEGGDAPRLRHAGRVVA